MGFELTTDLDYYKEGRKKIGFCRTTDLKSYEYKRRGRKIMGFEPTTDLDDYEERRKKMEFRRNTDMTKRKKTNKIISHL